MPIKFRCQKCRQFLGISRAKAGQLVDCPTCGRTIRVPTLDGRVDPVPEPNLNVRDEKLAAALDELVSLNDTESAPRGTSAADVEPIGAPQVSASETSPKPIAAMTTPEPIVVDVPVDRPQPIADRVAEPRSERELADESVRADPLDVVAEMSRLPTTAVPGNDGRSQSRRRSSPWLFLMVGLVVLAIGAAVWHFKSDTSVAESVQEAEPLVTADGAETRPAEPVAIRGRISWKTPEGTSKPDTGAVILVLPDEREGESRLSIAGLRPGDAEADRTLLRQSLRTLGGDVAFADEAGNYEIGLVRPGDYHIVVVSHFQPRSENEIIPTSLQNLLLRFFERPGQLLGRLAFRFTPIKYNGETEQIWDHSFDPASL